MKFKKGFVLSLLLAVIFSAFGAKITDNILLLGDNTNADKIIKVRDGSANPAFLKFDGGTSEWKFSNDGIAELVIGVGGGDAGVGVIYNLPAREALFPRDTIFNQTLKVLAVVEGNKHLEIDDLTNDEDSEITLGSYITKDLETNDANHDLAQVIEDKINANVNLTGFTVRFSKSNRTFTFSHVSTFSIKCQT